MALGKPQKRFRRGLPPGSGGRGLSPDTPRASRRAGGWAAARRPWACPARSAGPAAEGRANAEAMRGLYHHDVAPDGTRLTTSQRRHTVPGQGRPGRGGQGADRRPGGRARPVRDAGEDPGYRDRRDGEGPHLHAVHRHGGQRREVGEPAAGRLPGRGEAGAGRGPRAGCRASSKRGPSRSSGRWRRPRARWSRGWSSTLAYVRTGHHSATSGEWRDADGLAVGGVPAAHQPGRRAEPSHPPGDPQPGAARGRSRRQVAGASRQADMGRAAVPRRARHADPGRGSWPRSAFRWSSRKTATASTSAGSSGRRWPRTPSAAPTWTPRSASSSPSTRRDHEGRAPDRAALYKLRKKATVETRDPKEHPPERTAEQEAEAAARALAEWMRQAEDESVQLLRVAPRQRWTASRPSTGRAGCRAKRSEPGPSGSAWPRCSARTRRGRAGN